MSDIVNLRRTRKRNERKKKERTADENRRAHGRPAAEKQLTTLSRGLDEKRFEAHRRERDDGTPRP